VCQQIRKHDNNEKIINLAFNDKDAIIIAQTKI